MTAPQNESSSPAQDPVIQDGKFFAAMGYISLLCFVPLVLKKENSFAQFHGKQALVLFIFEVAVSILKALPILGDLVYTVGFVVFGMVSLVAIIRVLMGERWEIPLVHDIAERISL